MKPFLLAEVSAVAGVEAARTFARRLAAAVASVAAYLRART